MLISQQCIVISLAFLLAITGVECVSVSSMMVVPSRVLEGGSVRLGCRYKSTSQHDDQQTNETLYSLRWYQSNQEFFSLLPARKPQVRTYKIAGLQIQAYHQYVDEDLSGGGVVLDLFNVTKAATGTFTCEVSSEAPQFTTTADTRTLTVIVLPKRNPVITGGRETYKIGDRVSVNCTAGPSTPPPNITWTINQICVTNDSFLQGPVYWKDSDGTFTALGLTFCVERGHFTTSSHETNSGGVLRMKCISTVENIQQLTSEEASTKIKPKPPLKSIHYVSSAPDPPQRVTCIVALTLIAILPVVCSRSNL